MVNKLIEITVELHNKETLRVERWQVWVLVVAALVSSGAAISAAFLRNEVPTPPPTCPIRHNHRRYLRLKQLHRI